LPEEPDDRRLREPFGTNHLGHFVFVNRIASMLKPGSRLVNPSSLGHQFSDVDLDDPNFEHTPHTEFGAYGLEDRQYRVRR
jgi:NAD(P)-dependent dehydrogenase (short-subunit alcohol dehydrogenase family)